MSKVKSTVICVLVGIAIVVAAFFATISFPVGEIHRINSLASGIHLGADLSGYAYTTIYPKGVITTEDYESLSEEDANAYEKLGGLYVNVEDYTNLDELKADVAADAQIIASRLDKKGYSSYSVSVEDEISIKVAVPTNFTYAAYTGNDTDAENSDTDVATSAITILSAGGYLTLRTPESSYSQSSTDGSTETVSFYDDGLGSTARVNGAYTYSIAGTDDVTEYFESITASTFGASTVITINFTEDGASRFAELTAQAASSNTKEFYFFVGNTQVLTFPCEEAMTATLSVSLLADSKEAGDNAAITLTSVLDGQLFNAEYEEIGSVITSTATAGEHAAPAMAIASLVILVVLIVVSFLRYKKLGAVNMIAILAFALVAVYALYVIGIQTTFAVVLCAFIALALLMVSNGVVFSEVKRLAATGRTMQTSVKEAYKNVLMTVSDMHIVLFIVAILLATVGVGEVAACGLIMVVGTIASYVLYWFSRLMWYVISAPVRDKFAFAGLKRVVYDDED